MLKSIILHSMNVQARTRISKCEENILQLAEFQNGIVTTLEVTKANIPRRCLGSLVDLGLLQRVERGVYTLPEAWEDDLFILQNRFSRGIFSHETALYLHELTDRTPIKYTMTFPFGYNLTNVVKQGIIAKSTNMDLYSLGKITVMSPAENTLYTYDIERTLCDVVRTRHRADIQIVNEAFKNYVNLRNKNIELLLHYAEKLRVISKVSTYLEILL